MNKLMMRIYINLVSFVIMLLNFSAESELPEEFFWKTDRIRLFSDRWDHEWVQSIQNYRQRPSFVRLAANGPTQK
ncbi:hypothetical protein ACFX14_026627 [Malus domestica]